MDERDELQALRRMAELEAKSRGESAFKPPEAPKPKGPETSLGERIATGLMDPVVGAGQIMDKTGIPGLIRKGLGIEGTMDDVVKARDEAYVAPEGVDWGRMAGNVANPLNYLGGGGGVARIAGQGAITSALDPIQAGDDTGTFLLKKAGQAALGGTVGGAAGAVGKGVVKPTADADALMAQGVRLTPGQASDPASFAARQEQKLTSTPFVGEVVERSRRRAAEDVQSKAIERATGTSGIRDIDSANRAVGDAYNRSVPHLRANPEGITEAANAYNAALSNPELTPDHARILTGLWDKHFTNYSGLPSEGLKKLDSELGYLSRKYAAGSPADQTLADELRNVMMGLRSGLEKGMPALEASRLRAANRGYREMIPINKAASTRADELATPRALQKAMARQQRTDVTRMKPDSLIDPAVRQMTQNIPDSGTAGRLGATNPLSWTLGAVGSLPASLAYNPASMNALMGRTGWQQAIEPGVDPAIQALLAALRGETGE